MDTIEIDTNKSRLNLEYITAFLSQSYWAKGRTQKTMQTCIDHSLCFGVYLHHQQIGFARIVTDYGQFAYLMDVFIDEAHRGKGYAKQLIQTILKYPTLQNINIWRLSTNDAHGLYDLFGFRPLAAPENMMEKVN